MKNIMRRLNSVSASLMAVFSFPDRQDRRNNHPGDASPETFSPPLVMGTAITGQLLLRQGTEPNQQAGLQAVRFEGPG